MKIKTLALSLIISLTIIGATEIKALDSDTLEKGKIGLKHSLFGYEFFFEKNPSAVYSVGLFFPDQLQESVKSVPGAYKKAEDSKNRMITDLWLSIPTGAFFGAALNGAGGIYLGLGLITFAYVVLNEQQAYIDMINSIYLYNQEIEKSRAINN